MHYQCPKMGELSVSRPPELSIHALGDLCLNHLAQEPERLAQFMEAAGYSPAGLRGAVGSRQLGLGLIDYFAQNEPLLVAFCEGNDLKPETVMRLWAKYNVAGG
jgi:hypothetical protein